MKKSNCTTICYPNSRTTGSFFSNLHKRNIPEFNGKRFRLFTKIKNEKTISPVFETVTDSYEKKRFNSPNDLVISSNGDIYFTDPTYGFMNLQDWSFDFSVKEIDFSVIGRCIVEKADDELNDEDSHYFVI